MLLPHFGKIQKPHTDLRKHKFTSEITCIQCSHVWEGFRMWFVFILPALIWDKGLVLVITLFPLLSMEHTSDIWVCYQTYRVHSKPQGNTWAFLRTEFTGPSSWLGIAPYKNPPPVGPTHSISIHWAFATAWQALGIWGQRGSQPPPLLPTSDAFWESHNFGEGDEQIP